MRVLAATAAVLAVTSGCDWLACGTGATSYTRTTWEGALPSAVAVAINGDAALVAWASVGSSPLALTGIDPTGAHTVTLTRDQDIPLFPQVALGPTGGLIVGLAPAGTGPLGSYELAAMMLGRDGAPTTPRFAPAAAATGVPAVGFDGGDLVAVWAETSIVTLNRFAANGTVTTTALADAGCDPGVATASDGGTTWVVWRCLDADPSPLHGVRIVGGAVIDPVPVLATAEVNGTISIAASGGRFMAMSTTWRSDDDVTATVTPLGADGSVGPTVAIPAPAGHAWISGEPGGFVAVVMDVVGTYVPRQDQMQLLHLDAAGQVRSVGRLDGSDPASGFDGSRLVLAATRDAAMGDVGTSTLSLATIDAADTLTDTAVVVAWPLDRVESTECVEDPDAIR